MTPLEEARAARGLPAYRHLPGCQRTRRPRGRHAQLAPLDRGRLRTLIGRMVTRDPRVTNTMLAGLARVEVGVDVTASAVRWHRRDMGLPSAPARRPRPY